MIHFTVMDLVSLGAGVGLAYAGPLLLAVAVLFLAVPALRQRAGTRRTAYGLLGVLALLAVLASPIMLQELASYHRQRAYDARTRHLGAPAAFGGITFPAGSTVHLSEDGSPEFGTLREPTVVAGLPLVGDFTLDTGFGTLPEPGVSGELAAPAAIHGIPCGPGRVSSQPDTTRCVLARDWVFLGYVLAAGTGVDVSRSLDDGAVLLRAGTLAGPELLYDVRWPAGTVLGNVQEPPERMAHGAGPDAWTVTFCLPPGATADIGGAVLHGVLGYTVEGDRRSVSPSCSSPPDGAEGYAQVGPDRFAWGERADARSPWRWTQPWEAPGEASPDVP